MKRRNDPHDRAKEAAEHARPRTAANTKINAGYYYLFLLTQLLVPHQMCMTAFLRWVCVHALWMLIRHRQPFRWLSTISFLLYHHLYGWNAGVRSRRTFEAIFQFFFNQATTVGEEKEKRKKEEEEEEKRKQIRKEKTFWVQVSVNLLLHLYRTLGNHTACSITYDAGQYNVQKVME